MNALAPPAAVSSEEATSPTPAWVDADRASRLVGRLAGLLTAATLALLAVEPWLEAAVGIELVRVAMAALLVPLAGLLATLPLARQRARLTGGGGFGIDGRLLRLARLARRPQGVIVPAACGCALALLLTGRGAAVAPGPHAIALGLTAVVLGFPLLVAERLMAATAPASLPEADALRALLFLPTVAVPAAGLLVIGAATGVPYTPIGAGVLAVGVGIVAAELALRALANWFLPPPLPALARAAVESVAVRLLQPRRLAPNGIAAPLGAGLTSHFGIDFSRSWALRFARAAALPVGLTLAVIAWGLSGVTLVDQDRRGIYERFGEPVAVWQPGAHLGLPWPLGRVRLVDLGTVHPVALGGTLSALPPSPAEAPPPASADRLWDQAHPSEVSFLLASRESDGRQGFQTVNVDMTVLYRIGADDESALRAAYAVEAPDALVRSETGRLMVQQLSGVTVEDMLGAGRETVADDLRQKLQAALDRFGSGIRLVAVALEAIHPPPDAASAYHNVQAAEIVADTAISTERGRALAAAARDRQRASELVLSAEGTAAETVGRAAVSGRVFEADRVAAGANRASFTLERYLATLGGALAKSPLVIIDGDLDGMDAPSIDLRSFGAPPVRSAADD